MARTVSLNGQKPPVRRWHWVLVFNGKKYRMAPVSTPCTLHKLHVPVQYFTFVLSASVFRSGSPCIETLWFLLSMASFISLFNTAVLTVHVI